MTPGLVLLLAGLGAAPFLAAIVGWKMGKQLSARRGEAHARANPGPAPSSSAVAGELTPTALRAIDRQLRVPGR